MSRPRSARLAAILAWCALASAGCNDQAPLHDAPAPPADDTGHARLALSLPAATSIERVEYELTFTFLEATPPIVYNTERYESVRPGGELTKILPCRTGSDGTGLNQLDVRATIYITGHDAPIEAVSSAVFVCVRNADTSVNMLVTIVGQLDGGFVDVDLGVSGTLCASKVDFKGDGYLGVCPEATCGATDALFVFANYCESVHGTAPDFWTCGAPTDWVITGTLAASQLAVPEGDGTWRFGVVALDPFRMSQVDPTLTDPLGQLRVWAGVWMVRAVLERAGGVTVRAETTGGVVDFAAALTVRPQTPGAPAPTLLLLAANTAGGVAVSFIERFGPCDRAPAGLALYPGLALKDVRRDGDATVRLHMRDPQGGLFSASAFCDAEWTPDGAPTVRCSAAGPLTGGGP